MSGRRLDHGVSARTDDGQRRGGRPHRCGEAACILADGVETVTYLDTPALVQSATGEPIGEVTQSGEHTFQVSTDEEGIINFEPTGGEVTATFDIRGASFTLTGEGGDSPVSYTCSDGELTQSATGYEAVFTRAV